MFKMTPKDTSVFFDKQATSLPELIELMNSDYAVGLELVSNDAVNKLLELVGPADPA
jgi:hypothetical protein